ncbi:MAG: hypothetical protein H0Z40_09790 [Desulfotomaculum sp.]|nr:hypothetical protein [Desulfotomaculum sp.]
MNTNIKRFLGYFLYMVFIGFVLYWGDAYEHYVKKQIAITYDTRLMMLHRAFFPVVLGVLLALPRFTGTVREPGRWCMDWVKLLAVSLPCLYIAFFMPTFFSPLGSLFPRWLMWSGYKLTAHSSLPITVFGIIFGYTLLTALNKKD